MAKGRRNATRRWIHRHRQIVAQEIRNVSGTRNVLLSGLSLKLTVYRPSFYDTITILAGAEKVHFTIYKDTICQKSEFLTAACKGPWLKEEKTISLAGIPPKTFRLYADWTYSNETNIDILDDPVD